MRPELESTGGIGEIETAESLDGVFFWLSELAEHATTAANNTDLK
jgi:hypothetical protein